MPTNKLLLVALLFIFTACSSQKEIMQEKNTIPEHLQVWRGLYVRDGDRIVDAPEEDITVAKSYPLHKEKGDWIDETRITLLASKTKYKIGEEIRVIHVVESVKSNYELYIMGPKEIVGEFINGELTTPPVPEDADDPLIPFIYNGAIEACPAVDYNYEITSYTFDKPGEYIIQWSLGNLKSNSLKIKVK